MHIQTDHLIGLDEDEFLAGPERYALDQEGQLDDDLLVIDEVFAKSVSEILADYQCSLADLSAPSISLVAPGYIFADHEHGLVLIDPDGRLAGAYLGPDIAILPQHRGKGLGSELVLERVLREQGSPVWDLSRPCYTRAGRRAHLGAWRLLHDADFRERKTQALSVAYSAICNHQIEAPACNVR